MRYVIFSKGLHSTWLLECTNGTLMDCGEGCATSLGYKIFVVDRICLSHSHIDHVAGLPSFIGLRNATKGANDKPLDIYYPAGNLRIEKWLEFSLQSAGPLKYQLTLHPMEPWDRIPIPLGKSSKENRFIEAFPVAHAMEQCFGYRILSVTRELKPEFQGRGQEFYRSLSPQQKLDSLEDRTLNKFVFSGDSMPLSSSEDSPLARAEVAFLDSTFLSAADRNGCTHASMDEVAAVCRANRVRVGYALHLSIRYSIDQVRQRMAELSSVFPLRLIPNNEVTYLN
jgi:ribonuclease Z